MAVTPGFVVTQATTLLLIVLGAFVLAVRPRTRASVALAVYAVGAGAGIFASNLWQASLQTEATRWVALILQIVAGAALVVLLLSFPRPVGRWGHIGFWGVSVAIVAYAGWVGTAPLVSILQSSPVAILAPLALGAVVLAVRFGKESQKETRSQLALVSAGTLPYLAMSVGDQLTKLNVWNSLPHTLLLAAAMVIWLVNAARVQGAGPTARNVALLIPATMLLGMGARAWIGDGRIDDTGIYGLARVITFGVLSYAILHHQLLGIDVKVRWTISKSTIAAVFIAVFFVASEAAQQFFGETLGSTYVGIAAAGALVFAIAPLQRAAERLAERAVPVAASPSPTAAPASVASPVAPSSAAVAYKAALRAAMRDGAVTRREERHLAEVARALGVDPVQAHQWRDEVEREAGDGRAGVA